MDVAIAQFEPAAGRPEHNRDQARSAISVAADSGADLVVLPELFTAGYFAFDAWADAAEAFDGPTLAMARDAATTHDIAIVAGSFVEDLAATTAVETPAERGLANTTVLVDATGSVVSHYRKVHLFGYESEEQTRMVPGDTLGVGELGQHTVGLATCYDLRFPELHRAYVDAGVTLLAVPSAWPTPRGEHWTLLCRVRAIENQWYLAAANGCGTVAGTELFGHSYVVDPWGEIVADGDTDEGVMVAEASPATVAEVRADFPVLADRREWLSRPRS